MIGIKKLDLFILKNFTLLFAASFFICLFVFMMQFTWRSVEELIGKGLTMDVFAEFFWYMGLSLVPQSLPLAILLAALISFGNMGERLELLSMKAAGVPLIRILSPLIILVCFLSGVSFYFQNVTSPEAELKLRMLLISMKESAPALEIPEGIFYNGVPNVNIYVEHKDKETNQLYGLIIYKTDQGFEKAQIVLADSGRLEMTADKQFLRLTLENGEQFENLQTPTMALGQTNVPYDRETFIHKDLLIAFDANFNLMDADALSARPESKDMNALRAGIDSMRVYGDSLGRAYLQEIRENGFREIPATTAAGKKQRAQAVRTAALPNWDSVYAALSVEERTVTAQRTLERTADLYDRLDWQQYPVRDNDGQIRRYWIAWHQKIVLSLACLVFFFIGAPLGSIIQKGGLGLPMVISVAIFILYYIISTSGMKLAREGTWAMWFGMWICMIVLVPLGIFFTYKANKDSVVFNIDLYRQFFRTLFGLRTRRHISLKEVIVDDPDYATLPARLDSLAADCQAYAEVHRLHHAPGYVRTFFTPREDHEVRLLNQRLEELVEELSNTKDLYILDELNRLPILFVDAHVSPFDRAWLNRLCGALVPVGLVLWLRMWRYRLRLERDLRLVEKSCRAVSGQIGQRMGPTK